MAFHELDQELLHLSVAEVMQRWPTTAQAFIAYRLFCIGCGMSSFDTLEEALEAHDVSQEAFLEDLRRASQSTSDRSPATPNKGDIS